MPDGSAESRVRAGLRATLVPATVDQWAIRVLTVSVVIVLVASFLVLRAAAEIIDRQDQAKERGCVLLHTLTGPDNQQRLRELGC